VTAGPTPREVDRRLAALRATLDQMSDNLVELDQDVTRQTLDASSSLTGRTAAEWDACRGSTGRLWQAQLALDDVWSQAAELRGTRASVPRPALGRLGELLDGPSVALPAPPDPSGRRVITEGALPVVQRTVDEVIAAMADDYGRTTATVAGVFAVWSTVVPALGSASAELDRLAGHLGAGGGGRDDRVALARSIIADYQELSVDDPLGVPADAVATVHAALESVRAGAREAVAAARSLDAALSSVEGGLATARATLDRYHAEAADQAARIAPGADDTALADRTALELGELDQEVVAVRLMASTRPADALRRATALGARVGVLCDRVAGLDGRRSGGLVTRDELRGRLGALQAKAQAMGRIEDPELDRLGRGADAALYQAPCDLAAASDLVDAYQRALRTGGGVG